MSKQDILNLINEGNIDLAIKALLKAMPGDNAVILQSSRWNGLKRDIDSGGLPNDFIQLTKNQIRNAVINIANKLPEDVNVKGLEIPNNGGASPSPVNKSETTVFISYNHNDQAQAMRVKEFFDNNGVKVLIDREEMKAGEDIKDFIERCIKASSVTLSLVSGKSLLSGWVGMESILTLTGGAIADKKLIACALENDFFDFSFMRTAIEEINGKIKKIDEEVQWRIENGIGIEDLQDEKSRNNDLKSKLPTIIAALKNRLTIDISGLNFDGGMQRVLETIT